MGNQRPIRTFIRPSNALREHVWMGIGANEGMAVCEGRHGSNEVGWDRFSHDADAAPIQLQAYVHHASITSTFLSNRHANRPPCDPGKILTPTPGRHPEHHQGRPDSDPGTQGPSSIHETKDWGGGRHGDRPPSKKETRLAKAVPRIEPLRQAVYPVVQSEPARIGRSSESVCRRTEQTETFDRPTSSLPHRLLVGSWTGQAQGRLANEPDIRHAKRPNGLRRVELVLIGKSFTSTFYAMVE